MQEKNDTNERVASLVLSRASGYGAVEAGRVWCGEVAACHECVRAVSTTTILQQYSRCDQQEQGEGCASSHLFKRTLCLGKEISGPHEFALSEKILGFCRQHLVCLLGVATILSRLGKLSRFQVPSNGGKR
jgi:hypothetical protein